MTSDQDPLSYACDAISGSARLLRAAKNLAELKRSSATLRPDFNSARPSVSGLPSPLQQRDHPGIMQWALTKRSPECLIAPRVVAG